MCATRTVGQGRCIIRRVPIVAAAFLLFAVPSFAQPASGTTASGLFYEVSGAGDPIVLIHAFSVDRRMWEPQIATFDRRFRIVRYDLRGHGRSAAPAGPYAGYADLKDVLDVLGIQRATLVGLSAGSAALIAKSVANGRHVVIPGAGHIVNLDTSCCTPSARMRPLSLPKRRRCSLATPTDS